MTALGYLLLYLLGGVVIIRFLLPTHTPLARLWLGVSLGLLLLMWLPALWAFAFTFGTLAHLLAACSLLVLTGASYLLRDRRSVRGWDAKEKTLLRQVLCVCIPLTVLSGYLQYTHVCRVDAWGNWNVGQSTYGDLPMHLAFVSGLKNSAFPPDYPFYPGQTLSYPFLADSLSTTLYLFGWELQAALAVPGTIMMALCYLGVMVLAREMTRGKKTVVLVCLLFFLNGGLGFLYDFDQAAGYEYDGTLTVVERVRFILQGYYKTPTNQPDPNNLRWSNLIADLLIPQRTLMGGYCMVIPCLYLLYKVFDPEKREEKETRALVLLSVWGGLLPLIHTHSFLALGLSSLGYMVYDLLHEKGEARRRLFLRYLAYGALAVVIACPQLFGFTFRQVFEAKEAREGSFLHFQFNWVNNPNGQGMRDFYLWFYVKNIGLPVLLLIGAALEKDKHTRRILSAALPIILAAELIRFQPNEYDNNKLFYLAYLLCLMPVVDYTAKLYRKMKGVRARPLMAFAASVMLFLSAFLTLWREAVSSYQAFSAEAVEAGMYARNETPEDSVFLSGTQHLNPISSIAGRTTVCGPDLWLYWHGIETGERKADIAAFLTFPEANAEVLEKYDVDYLYVSSYERSSYEVDWDGLDRLCTRVFQNDEAVIYRVEVAP
ncbi:MAG: hypothetical protein IJ229_11900 [Clostridia bacterium]|nr:hypothetical protein [Clostridia bacterium]